MAQTPVSDKLISASAADRLISAHDGDVALLYIYMARTGSSDLERAAGDLCRSLREISEAEEKLRRMGLLPIQGAAAAERPREDAKHIPPPEVLPEYRAEDITRMARSNGGFSAVVAEASRVIGRALSSGELKTLFGIYDHLGLPPEVIMMLLNYCAQLYEDKYGPSRRPSAKAIEKEAYAWADMEILTLDQAEEYIRSQKGRRSELGRIQAALGFSDRPLPSTAAGYVSAWLDMGFGAAAVEEAYDRTVKNTGRLAWKYMDAILRRWHEAGAHSIEEIQEKDARRSAAAAQPDREAKQPDLSGMLSFLNE